jgi:hypothetical protein
MSYLFDSQIDAALERRSDDLTLKNLKKRSQAKTASLLSDYPRQPLNAYRSDDKQAMDLVENMGSKSVKDRKNPGGDHASRYTEWRLVSNNAGIIRDKVFGELPNAYEIGLNIREEKVVGNMYAFAAEVFSMIDEYSSPDQDEGRR